MWSSRQTTKVGLQLPPSPSETTSRAVAFACVAFRLKGIGDASSSESMTARRALRHPHPQKAPECRRHPSFAHAEPSPVCTLRASLSRQPIVPDSIEAVRQMHPFMSRLEEYHRRFTECRKRDVTEFGSRLADFGFQFPATLPARSAIALDLRFPRRRPSTHATSRPYNNVADTRLQQDTLHFLSLKERNGGQDRSDCRRFCSASAI